MIYMKALKTSSDGSTNRMRVGKAPVMSGDEAPYEVIGKFQ